MASDKQNPKPVLIEHEKPDERTTSDELTTSPTIDPELTETHPLNPMPAAQLDDFNLDTFAIHGDIDTLLVKKIIIQVPVRKPNKQKFFMVKEGSEWEIEVYVLEMKDESDYYLILPEVLPAIRSEVKLVRLNLAYYLDGNPFLIPVPLPKEGKWNSWHLSLDLAVKAAKTKWVRAIPDKSINAYDLMEATGNFVCINPLPEDKTLRDYVKIAFRGKIIDSVDHPVIKQLLGLSGLG